MEHFNLELMKAELIRDEGIRHSAYQDHLGYWTIGVGRLIDERKGGRLTQTEVETLLQNDIEVCLKDISNEAWFLGADTDNRRRALVNMRFQLGDRGIRTFKNSLKMIAQQRWAEAGVNLRKSKWYRQTPKRAERVIRMIENG